MNTKKHDVWLILAKVKISGDNQANLKAGSKALVQCFIPETVIETALAQTTALLANEGMRRIDIITCTRYDGGQELDDGTPDFLKRDILEARSTGKAFTGTAFTSKTSSEKADTRK